ncbi:MAG: amidohydrolase family protein [Thermovirgaceae bacterium]
MASIESQFLRCGVLFDGNNVLKDTIIEISEGKIASIGKEPLDKKGVWDLSDQTIIPGIIDCHDHLGLDPGDEREQSLAPTPWISLVGSANARKILGAGITTLRDVGEKDFIDVYWKKAITEGLIKGPNMLISGQPVIKTGGHGWYLGREADGKDEIIKAVREQVKQGVDFVKVMVGGGLTTLGSDPAFAEFSEEEVFSLVKEAHRCGRKVIAHAHGGVAADIAIEAGVDSIEHGVFLSRGQMESMRDKGIFLVVTYGIIEQIVQGENIPEFTKSKAKEYIKKYFEVISTAREVGTMLAAGGDGLHGRPDREMFALVSSGFSNRDAIRIMTSDSAKLCGIDAIAGTIEKGKRADIVGLRSNPLEKISNIRDVQFVCRNGEIVYYKGWLV